MKKFVRVETTYEIDILDDHCDEKSVNDFSAHIFNISDVDGLFAHAASQISRHGDHFVEGIGPASETLDSDIKYKLVDIYIEVEED